MISAGLIISYSGLKNAVRLEVEKLEKDGLKEEYICDICASFEKTAVAHIMQKIRNNFV